MAKLCELRSVLLLSVLSAACGGSTTSGGSSGTSGAGGTAGSSGSGGSSGSAGSGGSSGSSGSSGSAGSGGATIDQLIADVCNPTPVCLESCDSELYESWNDAFDAGCEAEFRSALECLVVHPIVCSPGQSDPVIPPECNASVAALEECIAASSGSCSSGGGPSGCGRSCDGPTPWGVECTDSASGMQCTCTDGANAGATFSLPGSCSSGDLAAAEGFCT